GAGTAGAPRIPRRRESGAPRSRLTADLGKALARIHSVEPSALAGVLPNAGDDPAIDQIAEWESQLDQLGEPLPTVELGIRWLRAHVPEPAGPRPVNVDYRIGTFIVD